MFLRLNGQMYNIPDPKEEDFCWVLAYVGGIEETEVVGLFDEDWMAYFEEYKWVPGNPWVK